MASTRKKAVAAGAAVLAVAAGSVGVAQAVGGKDSDHIAKGRDAHRAKVAGVNAAGGGKALEVERSDEVAGGWEVKVQKPDSTLIEVQLNGDFATHSVKNDDDSPKNPSPDDGEGGK
jgi:hypothetical protein